jgi:hypothetical protein
MAEREATEVSSKYDIILPSVERFESLREITTRPDIVAGVEQPVETRLVHRRSRKSSLNAVETLAKYFRREFGYDLLQYSAVEAARDDGTIAVLFLDSMPEKPVAVGACCFRFRQYPNTSPSKYWAMQWAWMHPYVRKSGRMSKAWPMLQKMFSPFDVEGPLSTAMTAFLSKQSVSENLTITNEDGRSKSFFLY